jgi:hypothetical protein
MNKPLRRIVLEKYHTDKFLREVLHRPFEPTRLEECCIDRLNRHALPVKLLIVPHVRWARSTGCLCLDIGSSCRTYHTEYTLIN